MTFMTFINNNLTAVLYTSAYVFIALGLVIFKKVKPGIVDQKIAGKIFNVAYMLFVEFPKRLLIGIFYLVKGVMAQVFFRVRVVMVRILSWVAALYVGYILWQIYNVPFYYAIPLTYVAQVALQSILAAIFCLDRFPQKA